MADLFTVSIPCKPYIRKYLVRNFGQEVNFRNDPCLYHFFIRLLHRNLKTQDHRVDLSYYRSKVLVTFTHDVFKRIGYIMSKSDMVSFNNFVEAYIKMQLIIKIDTHLGYNDNLSYCIRKIQEEFDFTEDDFQFDSIKKYYTRKSKFYQNFIAADVPKNAAAVGVQKKLEL
jgi:hypothetical protein